MNKILILTMFIFFISSVKSQDYLLKKNIVYVEFLGNGATSASINYERIFTLEKKNIYLAPRIGYTRGEHKIDSSKINALILEFNLLYGKKRHFLETGIGVTFGFGTSDFSSPLMTAKYHTNFDYLLTFRLGYRKYEDERLLWRVSPLLVATHEYPVSTNWQVQLWFGLTLGLSFNLFQ